MWYEPDSIGFSRSFDLSVNSCGFKCQKRQKFVLIVMFVWEKIIELTSIFQIRMSPKNLKYLKSDFSFQSEE